MLPSRELNALDKIADDALLASPPSVSTKSEMGKVLTMHWYLDVLKKYADFSGRARRQEYWMFVLFNLIISIGLQVIDGAIKTAPWIGLAYSLAVLLPSLAVAARRFHDTGRSGWMLLLALIPLVGPIIVIVFLAQDSQPGTNQYGPNPKGVR